MNVWQPAVDDGDDDGKDMDIIHTFMANSIIFKCIAYNMQYASSTSIMLNKNGALHTATTQTTQNNPKKNRIRAPRTQLTTLRLCL